MELDLCVLQGRLTAYGNGIRYGNENGGCKE